MFKYCYPIVFIFFVIILAACNGAGDFVNPSPTTNNLPSPTFLVVENLKPSLTPTIMPTISPTATMVPTKLPTPTVTVTPYDLSVFETKKILRNVLPQTYIASQCDYLSYRWGSSKSKPGTIVVPIMYHSVRQEGKPVTDNLTVSHEYFQATMDHAKKLGFETITAQELSDFLYFNESIPQLSMILIIDDRRPGVIRDHFLPILEQNDWTVTLAYISGIANEREWIEMRELNSSNRLDMQAHGFFHNGSTYFTEFTSSEIIEEEILRPLDVIEENFGTRPIAFIWPGGNFVEEAVATLRSAKYQIGFTAYARGPLMFNWIPLGEQEIAMNDPLLLLPRYWSTTAYVNLDEAVEISSQAAEFAEMNKLNEYQWYEDFCQGFPEMQILEEGESN